MSSRYQDAYKELGNERRQSDVPVDLVEVLGSKSKHTPFEQFWTLRRLVIVIVIAFFTSSSSKSSCSGSCSSHCVGSNT